MTSSGAFGCTISGAGPTVLAIVEDEDSGDKVLKSMCNAFEESGHLRIQKAQTVHVDVEGARIVNQKT